MKRFFALLFSLLIAVPAFGAARPDGKNGVYLCNAMTGSGSQSLDSLDITGAGTPNAYDLADGDGAFVFLTEGIFFFIYDADATDAEYVPADLLSGETIYVRPDDFATVGVWKSIGSTGAVTIDALRDAIANGTIDISDYTIAYQIGDDGELRIGDIAGGAYLEFTKGLVRFVGAYYMEASPTLDGVDADGDWSGENLLKSFDAAETNDNFGQAVYIQSDGEIAAADCDSSSTMPAAGFAVLDSGSNQRLLRSGKIFKSAWNWTPGQPVYVSGDPTTTDGLTQTAPSTTGQLAQIVGIADSADSILVELHPVVEVP